MGNKFRRAVGALALCLAASSMSGMPDTHSGPERSEHLIADGGHWCC